jgi:dTDP-4-dehydrorhamnose 3,5-epimerase
MASAVPRPPESSIPGVRLIPLTRREDPRGWLCELFRQDELPQGFEPAMGYISVTHPGVSRGPHEHVDQTDCFAFLSGRYVLHLWDNRGSESSYEAHAVGESNPMAAFVPPGVVHAYQNVGESDAFVINLPNRLYAGYRRQEPVDEIRHESDPASRFRIP